MAQVEVTYSDNHSINVESNKKIKEVTLSGKYENGNNYNQDLTNNLPFTFNPKNLGLLKNSIFNLNISLGGDDMKTWLLQPATLVGTVGGTNSLAAGETLTYGISAISNGYESFFDFLTSDAEKVIQNIGTANNCDVMTTVVISAAPFAGTTPANIGAVTSEKYGFYGVSVGACQTITVHRIDIVDAGKTYVFSPDINQNITPSTLYYSTTNLSNTTITSSVAYIFATYYVTPVSEFPEGWSILAWKEL